MMTQKQMDTVRQRVKAYLQNAGIVITPEEQNLIEVADFGLDMLEQIGLELVVYVNTERCCAKELVLFPDQICPEHRHPPFDETPGKEETFRCRWGKVNLYVAGESEPIPSVKLPAGKEGTFTVWRRIVLNPGEQYTLPPNTLHWFQAGPGGAVVSEFSTQSRDELDIFTDPAIIRVSSTE